MKYAYFCSNTWIVVDFKYDSYIMFSLVKFLHNKKHYQTLKSIFVQKNRRIQTNKYAFVTTLVIYYIYSIVLSIANTAYNVEISIRFCCRETFNLMRHYFIIWSVKTESSYLSSLHLNLYLLAFIYTSNTRLINFSL